jgi:hypothetical protein
VRTKYGDFSVTNEVPEIMITVGVLLSVTSEAIARTLGVIPPPRTAILSEPMSSSTIRFETSGAPVSSFTISWIFRPATVSPCWAIYTGRAHCGGKCHSDRGWGKTKETVDMNVRATLEDYVLTGLKRYDEA